MTRMTTQRIKILAYLESTTTHPSAEDVHKNVSKELPSITLATVYRNLNALAAQGTITRIKVGNTYRYDAQPGDHIHGICEDTGDIIDIKQPELVKHVRERIKHKGFTPKDVKIIVTGTRHQR